MGSPPPIQLDTLGMWDTLLLMVLALVVFGPRRLPKIGRQVGKLMYEFRKASNDFKFQMEEELRNAEEADRRKKEEEERQRALAAAPAPAQLESPASLTQALDGAALNSGAPAAAEEPKTAGTIDSPVDAEGPGSETGSDLKGSGEAASPSEPAILSSQPPSAGLNADSPSAGPNLQPPLNLQPPSTGEKIAAEPPNQKPQQRELFAGTPGPTAETAERDAQREARPETEPEAERSEPAAHHG
jgi:sec-independent protein translocase protein TatB